MHEGADRSPALVDPRIARASEESVNREENQMQNRIAKMIVAAVRAAVLAALCWVAGLAPALADTWTSAVTPTHVQSQDVGGTLVIYIATSQTVVNPASCADTDEYGTNDTVVTHEVLAEALAALSSGEQIQLYLSSSQCVGNRPMILGIVALQ